MQAFYYSRLLLHKQETVPPQRQDGILFTVPATLSWRETVVGDVWTQCQSEVGEELCQSMQVSKASNREASSSFC